MNEAETRAEHIDPHGANFSGSPCTIFCASRDTVMIFPIQLHDVLRIAMPGLLLAASSHVPPDPAPHNPPH